MTQKELADQATVSQSSITRLETGETMPSVFTMINIAKVLHAPISKLLLGNQCEPDDQISGIVMKMKEIISRDPKQGQALIEGLEKLLDACYGNMVFVSSIWILRRTADQYQERCRNEYCNM